MLTPLIPVKALDEAKGRLAPELEPAQRRLLAIAMLEDVLDAVIATPGLKSPVVVSPDHEVWNRAEALGCRVVEEEPPGDAGGDMNASLRLAAARVKTGGVLVVAADIPLADTKALGRVRDALAKAPVVVVPSKDGTGTNVLGWADLDGFTPSFGPDSAKQHLAVPGAVSVTEPTLGLDVDAVEDLREAAGQLAPDSVTSKRLTDLRLREKLEPAAE